jgi:hypothetical protein
MRALALLLLFAAPQQYDETITVVRYVLNVRVVDGKGKPVEDLTASDFTIRIAGKPAAIEGVNWVRGGESIFTTGVTEDAALLPELPDPQPRSFVVYMQTDFGRNAARVRGQIKGNYVVEQILDSIEADARVAVVSHDSQLKLRSDFTRHRDVTRKAIRNSIRIERHPPPATPADDDVALASHLDTEEMKHATNAEEGLLLLARALRNIEGPKILILAGWGLGELSGPWVVMPAGWAEAVTTLLEEKIPVITLGTGLGGQLTTGLVATAKTTGGLHVDTQDFAQQAVIRASGAIAGQYEIALRTDELLPTGNLPLEVKVNRRGVTVQAPPFVINSR